MANLSVKWAAFLIADGILFVLLGASRYIWPFPTGIFTVMPIPAEDAETFVLATIKATYNYYWYGALFITVGFGLLLIRYVRNRSLKGTPVLENIVD